MLTNAVPSMSIILMASVNSISNHYQYIALWHYSLHFPYRGVRASMAGGIFIHWKSVDNDDDDPVPPV